MTLFEKLDAEVDARGAELSALASRIHAHPELRFEEHKAVSFIAELLEKRGVAVERHTGGLPTSFRATAGREGGPRVAILAEYDALPGVGHACGHNLIAAGAVGAFLALAAAADELGGTAELIGTR